MKIGRKAILLLCAFVLMVFSVLELQVVSNVNAYSPHTSQAALILGHSLCDGMEPDTYLVTRLEKGLEMYQSGLCEYIIVSGGQGPSDKLPVAEAMKSWLIKKGVADTKILTENKAKNTYENMLYSKEITVQKGLQSIIIVTSDFHIYRSMMLAKGFFGTVSGAAAPSPKSAETVLWYLREPFSLLKYYVTRQ